MKTRIRQGVVAWPPRCYQLICTSDMVQMTGDTGWRERERSFR